MRIPARWYSLLRSSSVEKAILVTIAHPRMAVHEAEDKHVHLMTIPGALRYSTTCDVNVAHNGVTYPFWPMLLTWPEVSFSFSPTERRCETPEVEIELGANAQFPHALVAPDMPPAFVAQVDLWARHKTNPLEANQLITLLQGPVIAAKVNRRSGAITLTVRDGDPQGDILFPPGQTTINSQDFPDAPLAVLNHARRQIVFGPYPYQVQAYQIDKEGKRFYLMEPWSGSNVAPDTFYAGGEEITNNKPSVVPGTFASDPNGQKYVEVVFNEPLVDAGYYGYVSASGGSGIRTDSVVTTLVRDVGGYRLTGNATTLLARVSRLFNFSIYLNNRSSVLDIVRERILPQTSLVIGYRQGKIETYELLGNTSTRNAALGQGFISRVEENFSQSIGKVFNVIEVHYKRLSMPDLLAAPQDTYIVDKSHGGSIGSILAASERTYGRRTLTLQAMDLISTVNGLAHPVGIVELGELEAKIHAFPHRGFTYNAEWGFGMELDINHRILLTDSDEGLLNTPTRVVGWSLPSTGPRVTVETEDLGSYGT